MSFQREAEDLADRSAGVTAAGVLARATAVRLAVTVHRRNLTEAPLAQPHPQAEEPLHRPVNAARAKVTVNPLHSVREALRRAKAVRYAKNRAP